MADGTIARLNVAVQADSSRFRRGLDDARKSAGGFAASLKGIGIAAIVAAGTAAFYKLSHMISESSAEIDKLAKTSAKLGLTVAELQRIQFAGEQSGVATEKLSTAFQRLTRRSAEAAQGTGEAKAAFQELGISAERFLGLSAEQKILLLSQRFDTLKTQADKVRVAFKLFDTEGVDLVNLLNSGSDGIKELLTQQSRQGTLTQEQTAAVEKANDAQNRLNKSWQNAKYQASAYTATLREKLSKEIALFLEVQTGARDKQLEFNDAQLEGAKIAARTAEQVKAAEEAEKRRAKALEEQKNQLLAANNAAKALNQQYALQRETFGQDPRQQQIRSLEIQGADKGLIEDLRYQAEKLKALEQQQKAQDKLRDSMQQMVDKAKELGKAQIDPAEAYKKQILDIIAVSRAGLITQEEYKKAIERTRQQFVSDQLSGVRQSAGSIGSIQAREKGTSAAFEAIDRFQKKPQDQLLKVQKESQKTLRNIDKNIAKGIKDGSITVQEVSI